MRTVNLDGTRNLLSAALDCGVRKVIFTSSTAVFGIPAELPITRSTKPTPCEPYGRTKVASEQLCLDYIERGLDVTMVRPRTILGHGRLGIFQMLFEWIREGRNMPVMGSGDNRFQFIHAHDLANAAILAAQRPGPQVYNRHRPLRQHARGAGGPVPPRGDRLEGEERPGCAGALDHGGASKLGCRRWGPTTTWPTASPKFDISDAVSELGWRRPTPTRRR